MAKLRKLTTEQFKGIREYKKYRGVTIEISVNSLVRDYGVDVISKRRKEFCQDARKTNYMWGLEIKPGMFFVAYDWKKVIETKSDDVDWSFALYGNEWTDDDEKNYEIIKRAIIEAEPTAEDSTAEAGPFIAQAAETRFEDEKSNLVKIVFEVLYNAFVKKDDRFEKYIKECFAHGNFLEVRIADYFKTEYVVTIFPEKDYKSMKHRLGTTMFDTNIPIEKELLEAVKKIIVEGR